MGAKQVKMLRFLDNAEDREAIDKAFEVYDKDKNGSISRQEFEAFSADLVEYFVKKHPDHKIDSLMMSATPTDATKTVKDADEETKKKISRQLARAMFQIIDADGSGSIELSEWKKTNWMHLVENIKTHMKDQHAKLVSELKYLSCGKWNLTLSGASDLTGTVTFTSEKDITGKIGNHPITKNSVISGTRIYLNGLVENDFPMGAEVQIWLDAIYNKSCWNSSLLSYTFSGFLAQKMGRGLPLIQVGQVTATLSPSM